jgi:Asp-tRNA(Asn)/Glu-tRNA(Gln) amidotransferase A subunit family amidase
LPVEVTRQVLDRIERLDPSFYSYHSHRRHRARSRAQGRRDRPQAIRASMHGVHSPTMARGPSTGVSSSGSGVATVSGLCYGTKGADTGGSIRFPSGAKGNPRE